MTLATQLITGEKLVRKVGLHKHYPWEPSAKKTSTSCPRLTANEMFVSSQNDTHPSASEGSFNHSPVYSLNKTVNSK